MKDIARDAPMAVKTKEQTGANLLQRAMQL